MKKKLLLLVTGLSSLTLLAACSNQSNHLSSTNSSSSVERSQSDSSESSSEEEKVDTSAYDDIISKYQTAVADNQTDSSINPLVVGYAHSQMNPPQRSILTVIWMVMGLTSWCLLLSQVNSFKTI